MACLQSAIQLVRHTSLLRLNRSIPHACQSLPSTVRLYASSTSSLPRVAQPSLWHSIVPKFLRRSNDSPKSVQTTKSKEWNPATFYIVLFMLIGSNAIQMIALRNDFTAFSRRADAKIGLLNDVIERIQRGEEVDVERILGTNDEEKEKEWEDVLREIEEEDRLWQSKPEKQRNKSTPAEAGDDNTPRVTTSEAGSTKLSSVIKPHDLPAQNEGNDARQPASFY